MKDFILIVTAIAIWATLGAFLVIVANLSILTVFFGYCFASLLPVGIFTKLKKKLFKPRAPKTVLDLA